MSKDVKVNADAAEAAVDADAGRELPKGEVSSVSAVKAEHVE